AVPTQHAAIVRSQRFGAHREPPISPVRSPKSAGRVVRIFGFEIFEPGLHLESDVIRVDSFRPSPADDVVKWRSKIFEHTLVDVFDIALWPGSPDQRRNRLNRQAKLLLAAHLGLQSSIYTFEINIDRSSSSAQTF